MIALTGATGFVGGALLDAAGAAGVSVRALARAPQPPRDGVRWVAGDLADAAALARLIEGADAVVHVAGLTRGNAAAFEAANVAGTRAVLDAADAAGVARLVLVSSLAAREPELSAYGASKARAEALVRCSASDWTIVRPPAVYGPRDTEMLELFRAARWGVVPVPRRGRASLIHVADLARLLLALASGGETRAATLEPDDGRDGGWEHGELARLIGAAVGRKPLVLRAPPPVLRAAALADTALRGGRARLTPDRARYLSHPDWVVGAAAKPPETLWRPAIAAPAGLAATARWYRQNGWL